MGLFGALGATAAAGINLKGTMYAADKQLQATKATNQTNLAISNATNAQNYKMFKEQQQYDIDMWNAQNVYNSAEQQRARLEAAGLNPYLMMNGGSAGTAGAANSASPIAAQAAHMETPEIGGIIQSGFSNVSSAIAQIGAEMDNERLMDAQIKQMMSDTTGQNIDNENKQREKDDAHNLAVGGLENTKADTENKKVQKSLIEEQAVNQKLQNNFFRSDFQNRLLNSQLTNENLRQSLVESRSRTALLNLDIEAKEIMNKYLEPGLIKDIALKVAQISATNADIDVKRSQVELLCAQAFGVKLNNKIVEKTANALIDSSNAQYNDNTNYYTQPINNIGLPYQNRRLNDYFNWKNQQKQYRHIPKSESKKSIQLGPLKLGYDYNYYDIINYLNQRVPSNSY